MTLFKKYVVDLINIYRRGKSVMSDDFFIETAELTKLETNKKPRRTQILNDLVDLIGAKRYLEIGVRDPQKNFNRINCNIKYSVDPGIEFIDNPVDFKMTSDSFFKNLKQDKLRISSSEKFDVIFVDGLHISSQVERDVFNSLDFITDNGFIILHDCNPPSEFHQREQYNFKNSPARSFWNGTTWKAFYKLRHNKDLYSICFDSDWGVGVISKKKYPFFNRLNEEIVNDYYEFDVLKSNRKEHLNLVRYENWISQIKV